MSSASFHEVLDLLAALASRLNSSRAFSMVESAGDEALDRLISNLNRSLNLGGCEDDPTVRVLDTGLSLVCFDAAKGSLWGCYCVLLRKQQFQHLIACILSRGFLSLTGGELTRGTLQLQSCWNIYHKKSSGELPFATDKNYVDLIHL